jgi:hypothetical protein
MISVYKAWNQMALLLKKQVENSRLYGKGFHFVLKSQNVG